MDLSPWTCGACGCQEIASDCTVCPQCGAPRSAEPQPEPEAPAAANKKAATPAADTKENPA